MTDDIVTAGTAPPPEEAPISPPVSDNKGYCYFLVEKPSSIQDIKNNLIYFRLRAQYSQRRFAKALGISQAMVSLWESMNDSNLFTQEMRSKICKLLKCPEQYLDRAGLSFIYDPQIAAARSARKKLISANSPPKNIVELKQNLVYYRIQAGMSQKQLSEQLEVRQPVLCAWESIRDRRLYPDSLIPRLAQILHCPESDLDRRSFDFSVDDNGQKLPNLRSSVGLVVGLSFPVRSVFDAKNNLRYYRKLRGLTLQALASRVSVVPATVSNWESDKDEHFIPATRLDAVAEALDCPVAHLVIDPDEQSKQFFSINETRQDDGGNWALKALGLKSSLSEQDAITSNAAELRLLAVNRDHVMPVLGAQELPVSWHEVTGIKAIPRQYACARMLDNSMANYITGAGFVSGDVAVIDTSIRDFDECAGQIVCIALSGNVLVIGRAKVQDEMRCLVFDNAAGANGASVILPTDMAMIGRVVNVFRRL